MDRPEVKDFVERQRTWQLQVASTSLVVNTLIAGVTYVGWMQPPLGFNNYEDYNRQQYGYNIPANSAPTPSAVTTFPHSEALSYFYTFNCLAFVFAFMSMIQMVSHITFIVNLGIHIPSAQRKSERIPHLPADIAYFFGYFLLLPFISCLFLVFAFYSAGYACEPRLMKTLWFSSLFIVDQLGGLGIHYAVNIPRTRPRKELRILHPQGLLHIWRERFRSRAHQG
jgi:hypothetical protein